MQEHALDSLPPPRAARLLALRTALLARLRPLWREHGHWMLPLVPFLILAYAPCVWSWRPWTVYGALTYQPLVPLLTAHLLWVWRKDIATRYEELCAVFPADSPRRRGGIGMVAAGCLLLLLTHATQTPAPGILAVIVIIFGVVHHVYGREILKTMLVPLSFLLTMVPPPETPLQQLRYYLRLAMGNATGEVMRTVGGIPSARDEMGVALTGVPEVIVVLPHYRLSVMEHLSGIDILIPMLVLALWLTLWKRSRPGQRFVLMAVAAALALIVSILRLAVMAWLGEKGQKPLAEAVASANIWLFILPTLGLTYWLGRVMRLYKKRRPRLE